jgi:hypothetical protein
MWTRALLTAGLLLLSGVQFWGQERAEPVLIKRYDKGYSLHSLEDNAAYVVDSAGRGGRVAVRVCSKESLAVALSIASGDPFALTPILQTVYGLKPDRIIYLRSEGCLGPNAELAATELWAVPEGAQLPSSVESIKSSEIRFESIPKNSTLEKGTRSYRAATRQLISRLRTSKETVGIVLGYYYDRPRPVMKRRLVEIRRALEQSGLPHHRYFVSLTPWKAERGVDPPSPEPSYPTISIVEVSIDGSKSKISAEFLTFQL